MNSAAVFIGIRGSVVCLDRATGKELWSADLTGSDFVTVLLDADVILAATRGEVFCLDAATGKLIWRNGLPGGGWGLASLATARGASNPVPPAEQTRQNQAKSTD
jgi:outer membrane protein assembly factor BamB